MYSYQWILWWIFRMFKRLDRNHDILNTQINFLVLKVITLAFPNFGIPSGPNTLWTFHEGLNKLWNRTVDSCTEDKSIDSPPFIFKYQMLPKSHLLTSTDLVRLSSLSNGYNSDLIAIRTSLMSKSRSPSASISSFCWNLETSELVFCCGSV